MWPRLNNNTARAPWKAILDNSSDNVGVHLRVLGRLECRARSCASVQDKASAKSIEKCRITESNYVKRSAYRTYQNRLHVLLLVIIPMLPCDQRSVRIDGVSRSISVRFRSAAEHYREAYPASSSSRPDRVLR